MAGPYLYDAVTLRHFGEVDRMDVLESRHSHAPPPRWTDAVAQEIAAASSLPECRVVLAAEWLGTPLSPTEADLPAIIKIQIGLNEGRRPPIMHAGEAEGIYFAERLGGVFVTDDWDAYDFARRRLGLGRVLDTIDILRDAVAAGDLTSRVALGLANAVRDAGRHLRRGHPDALDARYFD